MKKQFAVLALAFAVSNAFATNTPNECGNSGNNCNNGGTGSVNTVSPTISPSISVSPFIYSGNLNTNTAQGGQGGQGGAGGSASAGASAAASANNAGNTQSVSFSSPESVTIKTTGDAPSIIGSATAPCRVAIGASAGWLGGAFGIGTSVMDESCNVREISRHLYNLGLKAEAIKVMCSDETAKAAMGSLCQ